MFFTVEGRGNGQVTICLFIGYLDGERGLLQASVRDYSHNSVTVPDPRAVSEHTEAQPGSCSKTGVQRTYCGLHDMCSASPTGMISVPGRTPFVS